MTLTRVYLRLRHTTSKIKDSSLAFCLNRSVGYAHLAVKTRKPRKNILYLLLVMKCHSVVYTMHMRLPRVYYPGHKSRTQEQSSISRRGMNLRQDNPFCTIKFCMFVFYWDYKTNQKIGATRVITRIKFCDHFLFLSNTLVYL